MNQAAPALNQRKPPPESIPFGYTSPAWPPPSLGKLGRRPRAWIKCCDFRSQSHAARASTNAVCNAVSSAAHLTLRSVTHGDALHAWLQEASGDAGPSGSRGNDPPCSWRILRITSEASTIFSGTLGSEQKFSRTVSSTSLTPLDCTQSWSSLQTSRAMF
jgi:hypothetical protein